MRQHPFSADELRQMRHDGVGWWDRRKIAAQREGRLFDIWTAEDGPPRFLLGGGSQSWEEPLESTIADGTQISNSSSETICVPDFNVPAYYMAAGRTIRIWASGVMSNVVTTPGTLTMFVRWGGVGGTLLCSTAAQVLDTTARTNSAWAMLAYLTCRTAGSSGTFLTAGIFWGNVLSSTAANLLPALMGSAGAPLASANAAVSVDTTTAKLLSVTQKFSVATNPTNSTCNQRILEVLN